MARVLLVEDEELLRQSLAMLLRQRGHEVLALSDPGQALGGAASFAPEVLVTDWLLKQDMHGLELASRLRVRHPALRVVVITGVLSGELRTRAEREPGVVAFLEKPFPFAHLLEAVGGPAT